MRLSLDTLRHLRANALMALVAAAVGLTGALCSAEWRQASALAREEAVAERDRAHARWQQRDTDAKNQQQDAALIAALEARGVLAETHRLDWIELLDELRETLPVLDIQYEFAAPAQANNATPTTSPMPATLHSTQMTLHLVVPHEEDALHWLDAVRRRAPALIRYRQCGFARQSDPQTETSALTADCEIDWITLARSQPTATP
ncbi:hypothetical protein HCX48_06870 [Rhodocyclus tenuis]|uniref:Uncharacterized protein n=1 Tax=Rhodocyclus gracilis TaxID=2929842 RepID=A0ABX0WJY1_9RHOO|nr:hypothetical protein [Rhodocyclus gracilis]NJA88939.1 hypothetical protein [Rhodocyclus gracilis]